MSHTYSDGRAEWDVERLWTLAGRPSFWLNGRSDALDKVQCGSCKRTCAYRNGS